MKQSNTKYYIIGFVLDMLFYALLYAWQVHGIEGAGHVFNYSQAVIAIALLLGAISAYHGNSPITKRSTLRTIYVWTRALLMSAALVWTGSPIIATVLLMAMLVAQTARAQRSKA